MYLCEQRESYIYYNQLYWIIHLFIIKYLKIVCRIIVGYSALNRAPALGAGCLEFESFYSNQIKTDVGR